MENPQDQRVFAEVAGGTGRVAVTRPMLEHYLMRPLNGWPWNVRTADKVLRRLRHRGAITSFSTDDRGTIYAPAALMKECPDLEPRLREIPARGRKSMVFPFRGLPGNPLVIMTLNGPGFTLRGKKPRPGDIITARFETCPPTASAECKMRVVGRETDPAFADGESLLQWRFFRDVFCASFRARFQPGYIEDIPIPSGLDVRIEPSRDGGLEIAWNRSARRGR